MQYNFTKADFDLVFNFAVKYHLDISKNSSTRTSGASRGLGGVLDSFIRGKLVELGVIRIFENLSKDKTFGLDLEIKSINEVNTEPDIVSVTENSKIRKPNVYIEIKAIGENDRWIGITQEQFNTAKKYSKNGEFYILGAKINNTQKDKNTKEKDFFGSFLREITKLPLLKSFALLENVQVNLDYIISSSDLSSLGMKFSKDGFLYETEIFSVAGPNATKSINQGLFKELPLSNNKLDVYQVNKNYPAPLIFGQFDYQGVMKMYEKQNVFSTRQYIFCVSDVVIHNDKLGDFKLVKNKNYLFNPSTAGRNPTLNRNNIWIAKRNIQNLIKTGKIKSLELNLKKILKSI